MTSKHRSLRTEAVRQATEVLRPELTAISDLAVAKEQMENSGELVDEANRRGRELVQEAQREGTRLHQEANDGVRARRQAYATAYDKARRAGWSPAKLEELNYPRPGRTGGPRRRARSGAPEAPTGPGTAGGTAAAGGSGGSGRTG